MRTKIIDHELCYTLYKVKICCPKTEHLLYNSIYVNLEMMHEIVSSTSIRLIWRVGCTKWFISEKLLSQWS